MESVKKTNLKFGGKSKKNRQINTIYQSFIAMDTIETGFCKRIPFCLFGFLYQTFDRYPQRHEKRFIPLICIFTK